jgi:uncharacterized membrane protein YkvA (DUF1232 family)/3-methyladenine DNA glycosylase Tag
MVKGDHIEVNRGIYWHHGIYMGDGTVIHFAGEPAERSNAEIRQTSLEEFLKGGEPEIVKHTVCFDADIVVQNARFALNLKDSTKLFKKYSPLFNNCEHFASWCKTGKPASKQVEKLCRMISVSGITLSWMAKILSSNRMKYLGKIGYAINIAHLFISTHKTIKRRRRDYSSEYSEKYFWDKLKKFAKDAGGKVVGRALQLYYAAREPNKPIWVKILVFAALGYFICPTDLLPDYIPFIGYADDAVVLSTAISAIGMYITPEVKEKAEKKLEDWFG